VYDRVQENAARYDGQARYTFNAIMRRSLNQVLMRSVNTSIVAILPPLAIFVIGGLIYGQPTMTDFSLALIIGLAFGVYSSIGVAAPALVWLKEREPGYSKIRARARAKGPTVEAAADHIAVVDVWETGVVPEADRRGSRVARAEQSLRGSAEEMTAAAAAKYSREVPPRPRKQGKKR
ncbi:MAG: hypothetical protein GX868_06535, partial [Actinobacteria bacterium]|nr:hypothetical protein [Actinomycetota bacterium]